MLERNRKRDRHRWRVLVKRIPFLLVAVFLSISMGTSASGQTAGFSSVYTETLISGVPNGDYDELQPSTPFLVVYSIGIMDPAASDQSITMQTSVTGESGHTFIANGSGYSTATVMTTVPLTFNEEEMTFEVGNFSVQTTFNSAYGQAVTNLGAVIGLSVSCYELISANPATRIATMRRKVPCDTACGAAGDTLYFRYDTAQGAPWEVVAVEPYTRFGSVKVCSHVFTPKRIRLGPCRCGNVEAPVGPIIPIPPILNFGPCPQLDPDFDGYQIVPTVCVSPILVDTTGDGFDLTDVANGVNFDLDANGTPERISWTDADSTNSFLVLDRNLNGRVDDGSELFGNFSPQPASVSPNGFIALAEYDKPARGGNGNGRLDEGDAVFSRLRLWRDANHNGISEPEEFANLGALNLKWIDLDYKESKRIDEYGNSFRYRAKVHRGGDSNAGHWAWDVFLLKQP